MLRKKTVDFRLLAMALRRVRMWFGADRKVNIEKWYLSPYVKKPLNSKVIESFVPELRSHKCFSCFRIPMFYIIYEHYTFHIFMYGYVTQLTYSTAPTNWDIIAISSYNNLKCHYSTSFSDQCCHSNFLSHFNQYILQTLVKIHKKNSGIIIINNFRVDLEVIAMKSLFV